jgi:hypothetical protein
VEDQHDGRAPWFQAMIMEPSLQTADMICNCTEAIESVIRPQIPCERPRFWPRTRPKAHRNANDRHHDLQLFLPFQDILLLAKPTNRPGVLACRPSSGAVVTSAGPRPGGALPQCSGWGVLQSSWSGCKLHASLGHPAQTNNHKKFRWPRIRRDLVVWSISYPCFLFHQSRRSLDGYLGQGLRLFRLDLLVSSILSMDTSVRPQAVYI